MSRSTAERALRVTVKLKCRASLTRERTEELVEVDAPRSPEEQVRQLTALVQERYPGAELRVFHRAAGSFTIDDLHIVASYQGDPEAGFEQAQASDESTEQDDAYQQLRLSA